MWRACDRWRQSRRGDKLRAASVTARDLRADKELLTPARAAAESSDSASTNDVSSLVQGRCCSDRFWVLAVSSAPHLRPRSNHERHSTPFLAPRAGFLDSDTAQRDTSRTRFSQLFASVPQAAASPGGIRIATGGRSALPAASAAFVGRYDAADSWPTRTGVNRDYGRPTGEP